MAQAQRDENRVTTLLAVDYTDDRSPIRLWADPANNRLLVSAIVTSIPSSAAVETTVLAGEKTVADTATPEALAASTSCTYCLVQAKPGNTANVFVGNSTTQKVELAPGAAWAFAIDNLNKIYVDVGVNGEGVNYTAGV